MDLPVVRCIFILFVLSRWAFELEIPNLGKKDLLAASKLKQTQTNRNEGMKCLPPPRLWMRLLSEGIVISRRAQLITKYRVSEMMLTNKQSFSPEITCIAVHVLNAAPRSTLVCSH